MHRFTGNKFSGTWAHIGEDGRLVLWTPEQVINNPKIEWRQLDDSGDFDWPHVEVRGQLVALQYENE